MVDRPDGLHRLQRLRRRLPGGEQHSGRRQGAGGAPAAKCTGCASTATSTGPADEPDGVSLSAGAVHALRERAVRVRLPGRGHGPQCRGAQRHGLQPLRRHALLLEQLPVQGAALQFLLPTPISHDRDAAPAVQPRRDGPLARRDGEVHLLRAAHPPRRDRRRRSRAGRSSTAKS